MILRDGKAVLSIPSDPVRGDDLRQWLESVFSEVAFPVMAGQQILIAADEIFTNIASYAYPSGSGPVFLSVEYGEKEDSLTLKFTDQGIPFDPLQQDAPDISLPAEERTVGGLGILIVQKMMDSVSYCRENGCNVLTITKRAGNGQERLHD